MSGRQGRGEEDEGGGEKCGKAHGAKNTPRNVLWHMPIENGLGFYSGWDAGGKNAGFDLEVERGPEARPTLG